MSKPFSVVTGDTFVWNSPDPDVGTVEIPLKRDICLPCIEHALRGQA